MFKVLVTTTTPGDAVSVLSSHCEVIPGEDHPISPALLKQRLQNCDAVVSTLEDIFDSELLSRMPKLKAIANVAVGYDNVDVQAATGRDILLLNTPGVLTDTTADLAIGLLLATARRIVEADRFVRDGRWTGWVPELFLGSDVHHKTLGIIGFGRIGQAVARRALGFDMKVIYCARSSRDDAVPGAEFVSMDRLLAESDFISLNVPLSEKTRHLLSKDEFARVKPTCILINTARGAVVDQTALIEALEQGRLAGAGLDVFEDEPEVPEALKRMNQVVIVPHIGSATVETRSAMARLAVDGLLSALSGSQPHNCVNPEVWPRFLERLVT